MPLEEEGEKEDDDKPAYVKPYGYAQDPTYTN